MTKNSRGVKSKAARIVYVSMKLAWLSLLALTVACGGGNAASAITRPPAYDPIHQARCQIQASAAHPLTVEWAPADRMVLETRMRQGMVAVRYDGCNLELLDRCSVPGSAYRYTGSTRAKDELIVKNDDDLFANLPFAAAKLEGTLHRSGKLTVDMTLVGRYDADRGEVQAADLQGECGGATHVVYGLTVGAFDFYAGGDATVEAGATVAGIGAGGKSAADRETLSQDGDRGACEKATTEDRRPPEGCAALLRIDVMPVGSATVATPGSPRVTVIPAVKGVDLVTDPVTHAREFARLVSFDPGLAFVRVVDRVYLEAVLATLTNHREWRIDIQGHADASEDPARAQSLSMERAISVRQWLIEHGVEPSRLFAHGLGASQPIQRDAAELNRAVRLVVEPAL